MRIRWLTGRFCSALGDAARYFAGRWAELLDTNSHFSLSANSRIDPLTLIREFNTVASGFMANDGTRPPSDVSCGFVGGELIFDPRTIRNATTQTPRR